jgi:quinoprotein glucose dehydrogenase
MTAVQRRSIAAALLLVAGSAPVLLRSQSRGVTRSFKTWSQYLGGADSSQYSALEQINRSNVARLQVAWTYATADTRNYRFNPIVVDGTMYAKAKGGVVAIDGETGKELWAHQAGSITNRGMNYWESKDRTERSVPAVH